MSAILFIFYLARCLKNPIRTKMKGFLIEPKYADDMTYAGTCKTQIEEVEKKVQRKLDGYNLKVNAPKTERYTIPKPPAPSEPIPTMDILLKHKDDKTLWSELDWLLFKPHKKDTTPDWRECKLLGSKLDTKKDICRRKILTIESMKNDENVYKSKYASISSKVRTFNVFAGSVFLYNSELWTITSSTSKMIDAFHRRMLRRAIDIKWPKKISNEELYRRTKAEPWSKTIKRRRLNWLGHLMRLDDSTEARKALREALRPEKRKVGKTPTTWLKTIEKDLAGTVEINIFGEDQDEIIAKLSEATGDRKIWKATVQCIMEKNL